MQICQGDSASKTQVVYGSGLNFCTIKPYLATLDKSGLVEIVPGSYPMYRITQRGEDALVNFMMYELARQRVERAGEEFEA